MGVSTEEATAELQAVLASTAFQRSVRLSRLLSYLCTKYMAGEAGEIKEYSIGVEVLQRPASFDPASDAGARVEVHRLRRRLQQFYETEGADRKFRIVIPVGHYVPAFVPNPASGPASPPPAIEESPEGPAPPFGLVADILAREPATTRKMPPVARVLLIAGGIILVAAIVLVAETWRKPVQPLVPAAGAGAPPVIPPNAPRQMTAGTVPQGAAVRLSCGRTVPYTDRGGQLWSSDNYFEGGAAFDSPRQFVARAFDSKLFRSGRSGDFTYRIPLAKGVYELRLGFVETVYGPGTPAAGGEYSRTFDVKANGRTLLDDFDIFSDANGANTADTRVFKGITPAPDGFLHLEFHSRRGPALVNTIALVPAARGRMNPIRLVAQENFVTLANGMVWSPDTYVSSGQLAVHTVQVGGTDEQDLFGQERYGHFDYAIPVDSGSYSLSLYFAEEYFGSGNPGGGGAGSRLFDVFCNGVALLRNFDIFSQAGMNHAFVKTFHGLTPNAQGKLQLSFVPVKNYASIYALEVVDESQ